MSYVAPRRYGKTTTCAGRLHRVRARWAAPRATESRPVLQSWMPGRFGFHTSVVYRLPLISLRWCLPPVVRSGFARQRQRTGQVPTEMKLRGRATRDVLKAWLPENLYALCGLDAPIMVRSPHGACALSSFVSRATAREGSFALGASGVRVQKASSENSILRPADCARQVRQHVSGEQGGAGEVVGEYLPMSHAADGAKPPPPALSAVCP